MKRSLFFILLVFLFFPVKKSLAQSPVHLLSDLVQLRTYAGKENLAVDKLEMWAKTNQFYTQRFQKDDYPSNLAISLYPLSDLKPNIIFTSHLDIVPADDSLSWQVPPFSGSIRNDTIWGRGAIDCKGLAVMQLYGMKNFRDSLHGVELPFNVTFLGLVEEETNSIHGARFITENYLDLLNASVVFGEGGSGLQGIIKSNPSKAIFGISTADKSTLWLKLEARGRIFGHGAIPTDLYANKRLIKALINLIDEKKRYRFNPLVKNMFRELGKEEKGVRGFVIRHISWALLWPIVKKEFKEGKPYNTLIDNTFSITSIQSSSSVSNQMSESAYAVLDCRLLPGTDREKFIKHVKRIARFRVNVEVIHEGPNAEPSKITPYFESFSAALQTVEPNSKTIPILFPASTDNNYFRNKGIPVYGIIPSVLSTEMFESVHNSNERMGVRNLEEGIAVYATFLQKEMHRQLYLVKNK